MNSLIHHPLLCLVQLTGLFDNNTVLTTVWESSIPLHHSRGTSTKTRPIRCSSRTSIGDKWSIINGRLPKKVCEREQTGKWERGAGLREEKNGSLSFYQLTAWKKDERVTRRKKGGGVGKDGGGNGRGEALRSVRETVKPLTYHLARHDASVIAFPSTVRRWRKVNP